MKLKFIDKAIDSIPARIRNRINLNGNDINFLMDKNSIL